MADFSYRNNYGNEENYAESGIVLSPPVQNKNLYLMPADCTSNNDKIYKGDVVYINAAGAIASYAGATPATKVNAHSVAGVALADAVYEGNTAKDVIPVMVTGDVVVTLPVAAADADGGAGNYHVGNYIDVEGVVSLFGPDTRWSDGGHLVLGQILTGKTDGSRTSRMYPRYAGDALRYYHVAVRLSCGVRLAIESSQSTAQVVAHNVTGDVLAQDTVVVLKYNKDSAAATKYDIVSTADAGGLSNGVCMQEIGNNEDGNVCVQGGIVYTWEAMLDIIAKSPRAKIHPTGIKVLAAIARNEEPTLDEYFVGMRVTEDLLPITSGVQGNQFGHITEITAGTPPNEAPTITVELDPVATFAPAPEAEVDLETESVNEDTPIGTCLIQNPITGVYVPCRKDTDNIDGVLDEAVELPTIYGWTLQDYQNYYGSGVFYANGRFWKAIKKFAKGVYTRVIKPAAKWAISIARPLAGQVVTAAGNVLKSYLTSKTGALVSAIEGIAPHENARREYISITGKRVATDEIVQDYVDDSGSYTDSHPNHTYTYDIDAPTNDDEWAIGDCLTVSADTGKAVKITSYDTLIEAVVNWEPAQEPITNGWKIAGIARGYHEIRSSALKVGMPVLYDGTDASTRLAAGQATAIMGRVREVWQPSAETLAAVKAGKLPADEELPNCIIEVAPEFHAASAAAEKKMTTVYFEGVPEENPEV